MTVTLYNNKSEKIKVSKDLDELGAHEGRLKEECTILTPSILFQGLSADALTGANYAYIDAFKRYYFITNITVVDNNFLRVDMSVDVLQSYADSIKAQTAVIARNENEYNLYLNDGVFKAYQNPMIITKVFPKSLTDSCFILAVAGAG